MKRKHFLMGFALLMAMFSVTFIGCKDDDPEDPALETLVAGAIDLNGATSATGVPVNPVIEATFNVEIDPATATAANITMIQDYDDAGIDLTINVAGKKITVTPVDDLGTGTLYELKFGSGIKSVDGLFLAEVTRTFATIGTFAPSGIIAHWAFESNANDETGNYNAASNGIVDISYVDSRNAAAGKAANFNGTTSIIEIPNADPLVNTTDFTISFWVRAIPQEKGHFVLGLAAQYGIQFEIFGGLDGAKFAVQYELGDGTTASEDMWFPSEATYNENGGWQGWDFAQSLSIPEYVAMVSETWLHVTYTYDGAERKGTLYYNSEKMKSFDFDLWPDGDPKRTVVGMKYGGTEPDVVNDLAFGFIQSRAGTMWDNEPWGGYDFPEANHFKGQLDDVRIYHKVLSPVEIQLMYDSEKP
ncbi:MAG: LamG-like jellyroll fold domain-containing protein [Bacteroidales bacterium]|jgi:hypothetical protein|nr:LamG-like jellyroll fold domain-containing protein [Bacteroidales bacterium]NLM92545.1 hypothetical protein [Bacteroidales bacterium]